MLNVERLDNQPLDSKSSSQLRELETYLRSVESVKADKLFNETVPDEEPEEARLARNYNVFPLRQIAEHMLENVVVNKGFELRRSRDRPETADLATKSHAAVFALASVALAASEYLRPESARGG